MEIDSRLLGLMFGGGLNTGLRTVDINEVKNRLRKVTSTTSSIEIVGLIMNLCLDNNYANFTKFVREVVLGLFSRSDVRQALETRLETLNNVTFPQPLMGTKPGFIVLSSIIIGRYPSLDQSLVKSISNTFNFQSQGPVTEDRILRDKRVRNSLERIVRVCIDSYMESESFNQDARDYVLLLLSKCKNINKAPKVARLIRDALASKKYSSNPYVRLELAKSVTNNNDKQYLASLVKLYNELSLSKDDNIEIMSNNLSHGIHNFILNNNCTNEIQELVTTDIETFKSFFNLSLQSIIRDVESLVTHMKALELGKVTHQQVYVCLLLCNSSFESLILFLNNRHVVEVCEKEDFLVYMRMVIVCMLTKTKNINSDCSSQKPMWSHVMSYLYKLLAKINHVNTDLTQRLLMEDIDIDQLISYCNDTNLKTVLACTKHKAEVHRLNDDKYPAEFKCAITYTLMKDPVILPETNEIVERAYIIHHLRNTEENPFNRAKLTIEELDSYNKTQTVTEKINNLINKRKKWEQNNIVSSEEITNKPSVCVGTQDLVSQTTKKEEIASNDIEMREGINGYTDTNTTIDTTADDTTTDNDTTADDTTTDNDTTADDTTTDTTAEYTDDDTTTDYTDDDTTQDSVSIQYVTETYPYSLPGIQNGFLAHLISGINGSSFGFGDLLTPETNSIGPFNSSFHFSLTDQGPWNIRHQTFNSNFSDPFASQFIDPIIEETE